MYKCPTCGKKTREKDYTNSIRQIREAMDKKTLDAIDSVFTLLSGVEVESFKNVFFNEIKEIQQIIIRRGVDIFKNKRLHESGYGIKYLLGIIKGEDKTYEKRKEFEKKYLDRLPPSRSKPIS